MVRCKSRIRRKRYTLSLTWQVIFYSSVRVYSAIPRAAWFYSLWSFMSCSVMRSMTPSSEFNEETASWIECLPCVWFRSVCNYSPVTWLFWRFVLLIVPSSSSWMCIVLFLSTLGLVSSSLPFVWGSLLLLSFVDCAIARTWLYSAHSAIRLALPFIRYATCVAAVSILRRYA